MTTFAVPDMSCRHCVATIEEAVEAVDSKAKLSFNLDRREVTVDAADIGLITRAMDAAGYPATPR